MELNPTSLKRISTWGKILGVLMMIFGGIYALLGLFAFIVGAIPGLVSAFMGYLLFKSGQAAEQFLQNQTEQALSDLIDNYAKFLLIQGILMIVSVVIVVLYFIFFGATMIALLS